MERKTDELLNSQGVTAAYAYPTPRAPTWGCEGYADPDVFDPVDQDALVEAQAVCAACDARPVCFALGVSRAEWGVWGGVLLEGGRPVETVRKPGRRKRTTAA